MKTVLLIDDHPVIGVGLGLALRGSSGLELIAVASTPEEGLRCIEASSPDALVVDLVFAGVLRLDILSKCRAAAPGAAIFVFSSLPKTLYIDKIVASGVDAYLTKSTDLASLSQCLLDRLSARSHTSNMPSVRPILEEPARRLPVLEGIHLTQREVDVANRLAHGESIARIAEALGVSVKTAAVHRDNLRKKLNCRDTKDLVARLARLDGAADGGR